MEKNKESLENAPGQGKVMVVIVILCFLLILTQLSINIVKELL
jgi:hypothetical protein